MSQQKTKKKEETIIIFGTYKFCISEQEKYTKLIRVEREKMKVLFLHLSDAHFKDDTFYSEKIINAQVQALNSIGEFNRCFIMFSGDLAFSGQINEYRKAGSYIGRLVTRIREKFSKTNSVYAFVVPGNHDINFNGESRDRTSIKTMINEGKIDEKIDDELTKFDNFYDYASQYNYFTTHKLCFYRVYECDGKRIQINLINSELFSSYNDTLQDDDKGLHYLPNYIWNYIERKRDVDFVVTMSHRGPEWFDWDSSRAFKKHLFTTADLFLYGHEHFDDIQNLCQKDNYVVKSIAQGMDFDQNKISFTAILADLDRNKIETKCFSWDNEEQMFVSCNENVFDIQKTRSSQYLIEPNEKYKKEISLDDDRHDVGSYYVFPGVEVEGKEKYEEIKNFSEFLELLTTKKQTIIQGNDSSGKTALLKQIYVSLIGNYVPIYLNIETIVNKNPETVLKNAFASQYGEKATDFDKYSQIDQEKKIVLVDDLSKIKPRFIEPLYQYLFEKVGHVVCIVEPKQKIDFIDIVKERYQTEDTVKVSILPFYVAKRLELIKKNLVCINNGEYSDLDAQAEAINKFIRENIKLFSLSPRFIKMYVDYCINDTEMTSANKNVFGRVFETNLVNRIRKFASDADVDEYSVLLEEIAYQIHFNEKYPLGIADMVEIIEGYNRDYTMHVNVQKFCQVMIDAKVLVEDDNSYYFYSDNFLAYFVAKSLNTRYNNGEGKDELQTLIRNICFNINGDILLFLSYITSNLGILSAIRQAAEDHMSEWEEFDIDKGNIGFILNAKCPVDTLPSDKERKQKEKREEAFEKAASKQDKIERERLYDYNEADIETDDYKISQALRFLDLICKILPGFNHRLKTQEKANIAKDIYSFPNKIIYKILAPIDKDFDNFVEEFFKMVKEIKEDITEDEIRQAFINVAETLALNIYDASARLSATEKTIEVIDQEEKKNTNYLIQQVMFYENMGKFGAFTDKAIALYDSTKVPLVKSMLTRIVHKHYLCNKDIKIVGKAESVARKFLGKSFSKAKLLN